LSDVRFLQRLTSAGHRRLARARPHDRSFGWASAGPFAHV